MKKILKLNYLQIVFTINQVQLNVEKNLNTIDRNEPVHFFRCFDDGNVMNME